MTFTAPDSKGTAGQGLFTAGDGTTYWGGVSVDWSAIANKPSTFTPSTHTQPVSTISDATATGKTLVTAADAAAARAAIGVGDPEIQVVYPTPADGTEILRDYAVGMTISRLRNLRTSVGALTLTIQINGVNVTGLTNIAVTTTPQTPTATAANVVAAGARITQIITATAGGAANLVYTLQGTR